VGDTRVGFERAQPIKRPQASAQSDRRGEFFGFTFNANVTWRLGGGWQLHALSGRGFRAPNLNDLGALGWMISVTKYQPRKHERLMRGGCEHGENTLPQAHQRRCGRACSTMSLGQLSSTTVTCTAFDAELHDPIVRRTLLLTQSATGCLADSGDSIVNPGATRETSLSNGTRPRAVKAFVNDGRARYGLESLARVAFSSRWLLEGQYSFITGSELNPTNVRRLPPQRVVSVHQPGFWRGRLQSVELRGEVAGAQTRLSSGDLTDKHWRSLSSPRH
jgi:hypothetical protein